MADGDKPEKTVTDQPDDDFETKKSCPREGINAKNPY